MNNLKAETIAQPYPPFIQTNIPLADKNWFRTGGAARYYTEPTNANEFAQALAYAQTNNLPLFILGSGANILISDTGFDGLVIKPALKSICQLSQDDTHAYIQADAGVEFDDLIEYCLAHNVLGLEEFSGIPGTVGGSVYINIHYFEFLLEQFLVSAQIIHKNGTIETVPHAWFNFGYNQSTLQNNDYYLLNATFKLTKSSDLQTAFARGRKKEIIRHRLARYPKAGTCGSFFRNFLPHEVTLENNGKKVIWVAYYLDKIGVKGQLRSGNAIVSHQHANMIVNQGAATSQDIITVAQGMQERVWKEFGILPQPECQFIGFAQYPLMQ